MRFRGVLWRVHPAGVPYELSREAPPPPWRHDRTRYPVGVSRNVFLGVLGAQEIYTQGFGYTSRKDGIYMAKYLLKASEMEFDCWRAAAVALGGEGAKLAPWIRRVLNEAAVPGAVGLREFVPAPEPVVQVVSVRSVVGEAFATTETGRALGAGSSRPFRPDPRPVSSKKGKR